MVCITILFLTASIFLIYFHLKFSFTIFTISKIGKISNCHNFQKLAKFPMKNVAPKLSKEIILPKVSFVSKNG